MTNFDDFETFCHKQKLKADKGMTVELNLPNYYEIMDKVINDIVEKVGGLDYEKIANYILVKKQDLKEPIPENTDELIKEYVRELVYSHQNAMAGILGDDINNNNEIEYFRCVRTFECVSIANDVLDKIKDEEYEPIEEPVDEMMIVHPELIVEEEPEEE